MPPSVVDIVFAENVVAAKAQQRSQTSAVSGTAAMPHMQGSGGVGGDEFEMNTLPVTQLLATEVSPLREDRGDGLLKGSRTQEEIEETGAGNLHTLDPGRGRQGALDGRRQLPRRPTRALGEQ